MTAFRVFTGIAKGGPLNGKVQTRESTKLSVPGHDGFYIFVPPAGAVPGGWRWVDKKGTEK